MIRYTTPTFVLTLPDDVDLSEATNVYFSLIQGDVEIQKGTDDLTIDGQTVSVYLEQDESAEFSAGKAFLQLNWTYSDGSRACSDIVAVTVGKNLLEEVVE